MRVIFFLVLLSLMTACVPISRHVQETVTPVREIRFLALGDSYTVGEGVSESERWPNQLVALVDPTDEINITIIARTGWTTSELLEGIQTADPQGSYDMVSLLIGVNNQYLGYDIEKYREEFQSLLGKAVEFAGGKPEHVLVLSIPDWGVTPFAWGMNSSRIASDIDSYNAVNLEESRKAGVHYVDVTPISREAVKNHALIAGDGLHPSGKMYAEWARLALPIALKILE